MRVNVYRALYRSTRRKIVTKSDGTTALQGIRRSSPPRAGGQGGSLRRVQSSSSLGGRRSGEGSTSLQSSRPVSEAAGTRRKAGTKNPAGVFLTTDGASTGPGGMPVAPSPVRVRTPTFSLPSPASMPPPILVRAASPPLTKLGKARALSAHSHTRVKPLQIKSELSRRVASCHAWQGSWV